MFSWGTESKKGGLCQWVTFARKVLRMFGGIRVNENWRKWYSKELIKHFGNLDIISLVRISQLNCIGHFNRMASKGKVSQVFNNNP
jgi:hypothetical protein